MPAHVRTQIRDAVITLLTGLPTTADRVHPGRARPTGSATGDCLLVYSGDEGSERATIGQNPVLDRGLDLIVEGRVSKATALEADDALNQIAAEVEPVMAGAAPRLGGLARDMTLIGMRPRISAIGESHVGNIRIIYRIAYMTRAATPTQVA